MKTPIDIVKGKILEINEDGRVIIEAYYTDWYTLMKREYKNCNVQMIDSRKLSDKQRRTCYMILKAIADYSGMGLDPTKEYMKLKFITEDLQQTGEKILSLSNAPMSLVCAFQRFLVRFVVDWEIPCNFRLLDFVDDVSDYIYSSLINKKCCICGKQADLHHCEGSMIGMGGNREEVIHEGLEVLPLCREHHNEYHNIGHVEFAKRYHIEKGIIMDKTLCKIYGLKYNRQKKGE